MNHIPDTSTGQEKDFRFGSAIATRFTRDLRPLLVGTHANVCLNKLVESEIGGPHNRFMPSMFSQKQ